MNYVSQPFFVSLLLFPFFLPSFSIAYSVWLRVSLLWRFCSVVTSVIDRTMCHEAGEQCSWKYIICNFSWVNIAGSLVKQRDKLFWERKCCLSFLKAEKKKVSFNSWKMWFSLDSRTMRAQLKKLGQRWTICCDASAPPWSVSQANQSQEAGAFSLI